MVKGTKQFLPKAISTVGGVSTGVAGIEALKKIPEGYHPLDLIGLDPSKDPISTIAAETALISGTAKLGEKALNTKKLNKLKKKLGKKGLQALARIGVGSIASGPFAPAVGIGAGIYGTYDMFKDLSSDDMKLLAGYLGKKIRPSNTPRRKATMKREKEQMGKGFSSRSKKLQKMLGDNPVYKKRSRKKGGKVGRPKGVGCAKRGYGKAMKRGK